MRWIQVEFFRSLVDIRPGNMRHPWNWAIIIDRHLYMSNGGFESMSAALADFSENGQHHLDELEALEYGECNYDINQINKPATA